VHAYPSRLTGGVPGLWRLGHLGNDAVMVFFALSGFVIAHVAHERERSPADYAVSRLARLYSVVVPAVMLTVLADVLGVLLDPALYGANWFTADRPAWRIAANLLFVNELWFGSVRLFSNVPFWSLGYEFWYYVLFGLLLFLRGRRRLAAVAGWACLVGPKILLLLPVWLLGVWVYRCSRDAALAPRAGLAMAAVGALGYGAFRAFGGAAALDGVTNAWLGPQAVAALGFSKWFLASYVIGGFVALHLVGVAAAAPLLERWLPARPIRYAASFTFALYLFHYPLLHLYAAALEHAGLETWRGAVVIPATLMTVWLLGLVTERRKAGLKRWLWTLAKRRGFQSSSGIP
jgi:peptidoglycan/LPS O-acetylase OafA/YrhL